MAVALAGFDFIQLVGDEIVYDVNRASDLMAISAVVELAGALLILFNYRPRLGGWLIVLFLVPVTIVVHGTAMITLPDPVMRTVNISMFLKGLAMISCALFITQFGVRPGATAP